MALKIRRGTDAQRSGVIFDQGEIVWTTDSQKLWVGDGLTQGGAPVVGSSVVGYGLSFNGTTKRIELGTVYTDDITESPTAVKKFFTQELAQDAAALLFTTGIHSGVTVQYDDQNGRLNLTVDPDDIGITDVVNDTTPQLGGNLDLNNKDITGVGDIDITGNISNTGDISNTGNIRLSGKILSDLPAVGGLNPDNIARPVEVGEASGPTTVKLFSDRNFLVLQGLTNGTSGSGLVSKLSRGTVSQPTILQSGDPTWIAEGKGWDGTAWQVTGIFGLGVDQNTVPAAGDLRGQFAVITVGESSSINSMVFDSKGILNVPVIQTGVYATTPSDTRPAGTKGMIIFNDTSGKFQGFDGTAWVNLN